MDGLLVCPDWARTTLYLDSVFPLLASAWVSSSILWLCEEGLQAKWLHLDDNALCLKHEDYVALRSFTQQQHSLSTKMQTPVESVFLFHCGTGFVGLWTQLWYSGNSGATAFLLMSWCCENVKGGVAMFYTIHNCVSTKILVCTYLSNRVCTTTAQYQGNRW